MARTIERQAIGHGITGRRWPDGSVADALRMMNAGLDYLNGPGAGELDAAACGSVLRSLGEIEAKFTAAHAVRAGPVRRR